MAQYDIKPYKYFKLKSIIGDDLEGHELWQHSNIKANGLAAERLSTEASKDNPVLVLNSSAHKVINLAQKGLDVKNQLAMDNINDNYRILIESGIPEEAASWLREFAIQHLSRFGGN